VRSIGNWKLLMFAALMIVIGQRMQIQGEPNRGGRENGGQKRPEEVGPDSTD